MAAVRRARAWAGGLAVSYANLIFAGSPRVGAILVVATLVEPRFFLLGLSAVLASRVVLRALGIEPGTYSPYGYNALLVGFGVAHAYALDVGSVTFAIFMGAVSVPLTAALSSWMNRQLALPVLSIPFVLTSCLGAGISPYWPLTAALPSIDSWALALPRPLAIALASFGSILFLPRVLAGAFVLVALLVHSRIATMIALLALACSWTAASGAHVGLPDRLFLSAAFNGVLAAMAMGGVWFVPSRASLGLALGASSLASLSALAMAEPFRRLGLPTLVLPFNLAVLIVLFAMRERRTDRAPFSASLLATSPEESLSSFRVQRARAGLYGIHFRLPFRGAWTCTQGVDGAFTHKDVWRHAFDFEVHAGKDGTLCLDEGERPEDYHCYRLPILATASGTVVAIENNVFDNAIGDINEKEPWGNRVTLQHGPYLFSTVAHLARGSIAVWLGQYVEAGDVLGYAGNSGRSPRPHLHFQLQAGIPMYTATLPCRFARAVVRRAAEESLIAEVSPREGEVLRPVQPHTDVSTHFDFALGTTLGSYGEEPSETLESEVDFQGRLTLRSREFGTVLRYDRTRESFVAYDVVGSARSVLYSLRLALAHVVFESSDPPWTEHVPRRLLAGVVNRMLLDFVEPFIDERSVEMVYRRSIEGDRVIVHGASTDLRRGEPRVRTMAVLARGKLLSVEVTIDGKTRRVEATREGARLERARDSFDEGSVVARLEGGP